MKTAVNNDFYDQLQADWYDANDHPIAILRAEQKVKNPWVKNLIASHYSGQTDLSIVDIGCGAGFLTNDLAKYYDKVIGVDLSQTSLEIAKRYDTTQKVQYMQANAYKLPLESESVDVVCLMDFLEHVDHPENVIKEASRILKTNGQMFFHTFNRNFISWLVVIKFMEWFVPNTPSNMHVLDLFIKPKELERMLMKFKLTPSFWTGIRPQLDIFFLKSLLSRRILNDFSFCTSKYLTMGYMGQAIKRP